MTKQEELTALRGFIASLGHDTYLRPWLSQVEGEVECLIRGDIFPEVSLKDSAEQCTALVATATKQATAITASAQRHADGIVDAAKAVAARCRKNAEESCEAIRREFNDAIVNARHALAQL